MSCYTTPSGPGLSASIASQFGFTCEETDLRDVCQLALDLRQASRVQLEDYVRAQLSGLHPDPVVHGLCELPWNACFTTNFDSVLLEGFQKDTKKNVRPVRADNLSVNVLDRTRFHLLYVMGSMNESVDGAGRMVLSDRDFQQALGRRRRYFDLLAESVRDGAAVFVGYSFKDRIVLDILRDIETQYGPEGIPPVYALFRDDIDEASNYYRMLTRWNVRVVRAGIPELLDFTRVHWADTPTPPPIATEIQIKIRARSVNVSRAALAALGPNVELLHSRSVPQSISQSHADFLKGLTDTWTPFEKDWDFRREANGPQGTPMERRIQSELARTSSNQNQIVFLTGPPGSGKSLLARRMSYDIAFKSNLPVFFIRNLGLVQKTRGIDELMSELLARYSDQVTNPGRGEEVKFTVVVDNGLSNLDGALNLFNHLSGNGRPVLMILVDRRPESGPGNLDQSAFKKLVPDSGWYELKDSMDEAEARRLAQYLRTFGYWDQGPDAFVTAFNEQFAGSFFSAVYTLVEPTRPPLTEVQKRLYSGMGEEEQQLYRTVATFHQFGFEPPFEFVRRASAMSTLSLNQCLVTSPGKDLFVLYETESGQDLLRTQNRILSARLLDIFSQGYPEQAKLVAQAVARANFGSEVERDFTISFLVGVCGHKAASPFSLALRADMFEAALSGNEDQVLLHHLSLIERSLGNFDKAREILTRAIDRGRVLEQPEENPEILLTSLGTLAAIGAIDALRSGDLVKGDALVAEARGRFDQVRQSTKEVGHAFHREALLDVQLAELSREPDERERLLVDAVSLIDRGTQGSQDEETLLALADLQMDVFKKLQIELPPDAGIGAVLNHARASRRPFVASSHLRRVAQANPTEARQLLDAAAELLRSALRSAPGDTDLLREATLVEQSRIPISFDVLLNRATAYLAQESRPAPRILFWAAVSAFQLGYFPRAEELFSRLHDLSVGNRGRSKVLATYVDAQGRPLEFNGVVERTFHAKAGRLKVDGPEARGQTVHFAPIGAPFAVQEGQPVRFQIVFSLRGPEGRLSRR